MASIDLSGAAGNAAVAYQDALNQARNAQNALLRQYGFTMMGPTGDYSVENAQRAFDPNVLFDKATGGIDQAKLAELAKGLTVGTGGLFGEIARGGATAEAEAVLGARATGLRGGLAQQRRQLAEAQAGQQLTQAKEQALAGLGEAMAPIGGAYQELQMAQARDKMAQEAALAGAATIPQPVAEEDTAAETGTSNVPSVFATTPNTRGGILSAGSRGNYKVKATPNGSVPKNAKPGQTFMGKGGVQFVYRPQGPKGSGWYKKK